MRIGLLTSLTLAVSASFCSQASASSDNTCYPHWSMLKYSLDVCSNLTFLSPGNDSRVNLRLLLSDQGSLPLAPNPLSEEDLDAGFGPVPFANSRLDAAPAPVVRSAPGTPVASPLDEALGKLGITRESDSIISLLSGEGGRCRSNDVDSATAFINQLLSSTELTDPERQALARARVHMLDTCAWDPAQRDSLVPAVQSAQGQAFASYLRGAIDFYAGRFAEATQAFASLSDNPHPWLKETAQYMQARTALNLAQQNTFDSGGMPTQEEADATQLKLAEEGFEHYLSTWPQGLYATSARGLLRRVYWLAGNAEKQAAEYLWQLDQAKAEQRNVTPDELVQEIDNKMLFGGGKVEQPLFQALDDLMGMRPGYGENAAPKLTLEILQAQKPIFAAQPALYDYLQAAFQLYVAKNPDQALKSLPSEIPAKLDYLAFSQQMLRGLALEAKQDWSGAEALWLQLLPQARQPLQREQVELALANHYERSQQLAKVFASDSPIKTAQVRAILLRHIADASLLRQVAQGAPSTERDTALFVLLYKDLRLGYYADFAADLKQLPTEPAESKLGTVLGYTDSGGRPLKLFRWDGAKAESGYACPSIGETAATLQTNAKQPQALNCLGEFILRNNLDGMPLDSQRSADELGGTPSLFKGATFSRLDGYQSVMADAKAPSTDKAYALFRAINCYAPSGYNSCGGKEATPAQRKAWFKQLKTSYASTPWGKSLQYYW
ncbi:outer membrane assembly lipoprotein YfiO [Pseudomonas sp. FEN]|uniref:outer membrane assembly lipoprotein YfiO n=1 Tax=Pseudomonas sp. FEN TaxID=2767468 RepID=UPI001747F5E1|nr:outer membrane assembly lipoprotein YfiO [Pseudomonas sp. FEN]